MLKQTRRAVRNFEKLRMTLGSSTIYMLVTWSVTLRQIETFISTSIVRKKTIKVFRPLKEEELVSQLQKLNRLRNLMVSLQMCSTKMIVVRSHFSVGWPLSWMTNVGVTKLLNSLIPLLKL